MDNLLYGAAYYDEYMPEDRLFKDTELLKKAGMTVIRIGESTWSTYEPRPGVFDFTHLERVLDKMDEAGIKVIVGTPTYAVPTWLVRLDPDILVDTHNGKALYGRRQNMDYLNPTYLFYAERIIRKQLEIASPHKCVIGFQIDNETKPYDNCGKEAQKRFVKYLREMYNDDIEKFNLDFGLDYWSNRINTWEDFPDIKGTINGSLGAEYEKFQRQMVTDFFKWQRSIINEYKRDDQFVTHNFDFDWDNCSSGLQTRVNQKIAGYEFDIAGGDIYHVSQDSLTGYEADFGGNIIRSIKDKNYLILETEAQGFAHWTPYPGQLRLQAFSHFANGADMVEYWHWHSIHNAIETYWKGVLSHDFKENAVYREACTVGQTIKEIGTHLVHLKKDNKVAYLVSNDSLTALNYFRIDGKNMRYNEVFRYFTKALYEMNVEYDIIWPDLENIDRYSVVIVPTLYSASEEMLKKLIKYVENGGTLFCTFKSAFTDEHVKVYHDSHPHLLDKALGVSYSEIANPPEGCKLSSDNPDFCSESLSGIMELLEPEGAKTLAKYDHYAWGTYSAFTKNIFGKGTGYYLACMPETSCLKKMFAYVLKEAGVEYEKDFAFPVIVKKGTNAFGKTVRYYMNFSKNPVNVAYNHKNGAELTGNEKVKAGQSLIIGPWNFLIIEEN